MRFKTLAEYRQQIREVIQQQIVDIVLMSASTSEVLCLNERLFDGSPVTPAARANDATDVHIPRGGKSYLEAARPFRSASLDHIQCGHLDCRPEERTRGVDLGLYSVTFNNRCELDHETLDPIQAVSRRGGTRRISALSGSLRSQSAPTPSPANWCLVS